MKEIKAILAAYDAIDFTEKQAALATVVRVEGSSYRRIGARMLVVDDGNWVGGISGGCLEGDALKRARLAIYNRRPSVVTYDTTDDDAHQIGVGLGCNGIIDVLFTPLDADNKTNSVEILRGLTDSRDIEMLVSVGNQPPPTGENLPKLGDIFSLETFSNTFSDLFGKAENDISTVLNSKKSAVFTYQTDGGAAVKLLFEVLPPVIHLVAFGGNYDVLPLVRLAREIGWRVSVVANIHKLPKPIFDAADYVFDKNAADFPPSDAFTAFVLMAHDYKTDLENLRKSLASNVPYIGLLGPRKRSQKFYDELNSIKNEELKIKNGVASADNPRIFAPVGLDIGAMSPEEIALSIVAEIQTVFSRKPAISLKNKIGVIHD